MIRNFIIFILNALPTLTIGQKVNIGERTFNYNDSTRRRPVVTELWYPTADNYQESDSTYDYPFLHIPTIRNAGVVLGKYPLIMISHGTGGGRKTLEWLADILVENGFIVAAEDHWGNTYDNKIAIEFVTPWERPQDISFALTQLLKDQQFGQLIDPQRLGVAGFSIGGYSVLALAGAKLNLDALKEYARTPEGEKEFTIPEYPNILKVLNADSVRTSFLHSPELKDKRIKAFFAICPAIGQGFTKDSQLAKIDAPVYIVGAQNDSIAPIKTNALHYHQLLPASKILIINGMAGHYLFLNEGTETMKKQAPFFFADDPSINRRVVHEKVGNVALDFFRVALKINH